VSAQEDLEDRDTLDNRAVAEVLINAFNERDPEPAMALIDEDAEWLMVPYGVTNRGPEGYRKHWQLWTTAAPDCSIEINALHPAPGYVVAEFTARGTHDGPMGTPKGEIPPTGRSVELRLCDCIRIENGKSYGSRIYFDMLDLLRQLGKTP
jgi:predicted ester cyclase